MSKIINIGVVGCGYWGPNLIRNFHSLQRCKVKFMCDANPLRLKHLKTLYPDVEGLLDFDEMLKAPGLDAVIVATSVKHHYPMAKASLLAIVLETPAPVISATICSLLRDFMS